MILHLTNHGAAAIHPISLGLGVVMILSPGAAGTVAPTVEVADHGLEFVAPRDRLEYTADCDWLAFVAAGDAIAFSAPDDRIDFVATRDTNEFTAPDQEED